MLFRDAMVKMAVYILFSSNSVVFPVFIDSYLACKPAAKTPYGEK
jgi:hypothetical protein